MNYYRVVELGYGGVLEVLSVSLDSYEEAYSFMKGIQNRGKSPDAFIIKVMLEKVEED